MSIELMLLLLAVLIAGLELLRRTIWKRYSERPKIEVSYHSGNRGTRSGRPGNLKLEWKSTLKLQNNSDHDAISLRAYWDAKPDPLSATLPEDHHLQRLTGAEIKLKVSKELPQEKIDSGEIQHPAKSQAETRELRSFAFLLEYQNRHGKSFYTLFTRRDGEEGTSKCLRRQPDGQWTPVEE